MTGKRRARGEGTVYYTEALNRWIAQITLPNGKKKTKSAKTQKEVRDWLQTQRQAVKTNLIVEEEKVTLSDFLEHYMEDVAKHTLRPKTLESYGYLIRLHIKPELGNIKLSQLRPDHVQQLYSAKLNSGLSRRTVQFIHSILHKTLSQALKWGLVTRNVTDLVEKPTVKRPTPTTLSVQEVKKLLATVREDRLYPMYCLAMVGLREGEILGLHYEDVDWEKGTIHIRHAVQYLIGQGLQITEPKTQKAKRTIKLPDFVFSALKEHADKQNTNHGLMFTTGNGTPFSPRNFIRHFKQSLQKAGLPEIRVHDLRHTTATLLLSQGVHPKVVQEILGHSQISLTMDTYSHMLPELQDEAAEKLSGLFAQDPFPEKINVW